NPYTVTPASTTTYSVTGTDGSGCSAVASVAVTVNPLPTVSVVFPAEVATVCKDSLVALSGGSPAGGVWSGTGVTGSDFLANTTGAFTITYTYTDANTCSNSATGTITVENCTSISEYSSNEMVVYPNPASDVITISFGKVDASQVEITLFDLSGRLVSNEVLNLNGSSVEVSVNQLPAGVYTLKVKAGTDVFFTKITRL
ncbi:MAG TPA: T9SS type A sorting domain-containing protein, partial [Bacteroidales bacterium]|nr:T9SS type A sorting domain-containing protein [Bacteroidales bacterium]